MAYVPRLTDVGMRSSRYWNSSLNVFWPRYGLPNCTCYAYGRWLEIANGDVSKLAGLLVNAGQFPGNRSGGNWYIASPALQAGQSNPQPGDIKVAKRNTQDGWGHVCVVEEVHEDYVVTSGSWYGSRYFVVETAYKANNWRMNWEVNRGYKFQGFLRMGGASGGVVPTIQMPTEWVVRVGEGQGLNETEELNNAVMGYIALTRADPTLTLEACCGILGNMYGEVRLNPGCLQVGRPSAGGLVGWDPLTKWSHEASLRGIPWTDGDGQCEWVLSNQYWDNTGGTWTLRTNFWTPAYADGMTYTEFKTSHDTPERLAELFCLAYEKAGTPHMEKRTEKARYYYEYLMGNLPFMTDQLPPPEPPRLFLWGNKYFDIKLR